MTHSCSQSRSVHRGCYLYVEDSPQGRELRLRTVQSHALSVLLLLSSRRRQSQIYLD